MIEACDGSVIGAGGIGGFEPDAASGQAIDGGSARACVAVGANAIGAQRVDRHEDEMSRLQGGLLG